MLRDLETLRREQAAILDDSREPAAAPAELMHYPRPGGSTAASTYGRVVDVINDDLELGPHLLVMRQVWSGVPPVPTDAGTGPLLCYPAPNRIACDYAFGEYVRLVPAHGAMIAERLA